MKLHSLYLASALLLTASCTSLRPPPETTSSEWLPTIGFAASVDDRERQEILNTCGLSSAEKIWLWRLDLDRDGRED